MAFKWSACLVLSLVSCQAQRGADPSAGDQAAPLAELGAEPSARAPDAAPSPSSSPGQLADPFAGIEELRPPARASWPLENLDIERYAGWRIDSTHGGFEREPGLVFAAAPGAFVLAVADAEVISITRNADDDLELLLDHGEGIESLYAPLSDALVHAGLSVPRGAAIGLVAGAHLRLRTRIDGVDVDPLLLLRQPLHRWQALLTPLEHATDRGALTDP